MQYGNGVATVQVEYVRQHLHLPADEKTLGAFKAGLKGLLLITSQRLVFVTGYKVATEIAGSNIASVTTSKYLGLTVILREKQGNISKFLCPVKPDEQLHASELLNAIKDAPAPESSVINTENEKWVMGVRVKMNELGTKQEQKVVDQQIVQELIAQKTASSQLGILQKAQARTDAAKKQAEPVEQQVAKQSAEPVQTDQKPTKQDDRQAKKDAKKAAKEQKRAEQEAAIKARGEFLGKAYLTYTGGLGAEYAKGKSAFLYCYEHKLVFNHRKAFITVPADEVAGFEVTGQKQTSTTSRITVTRMVTLGVFSLAAPKRSTVTTKEAHVCITLKDGRQMFFFTSSDTSEKIQSRLSDAISHYSSLHATQNTQQPVQTQDVAGEIERFAELKEKGILTDEEFQAKKKQLLGL